MNDTHFDSTFQTSFLGSRHGLHVLALVRLWFGFGWSINTQAWRNNEDCEGGTFCCRIWSDEGVCDKSSYCPFLEERVIKAFRQITISMLMIIAVFF